MARLLRARTSLPLVWPWSGRWEAQAGAAAAERAQAEALLRELNRVADEILDEEAAKDKDFAEILASQRAFRNSYAQWKSRAYLPRDF